MRGQDLSKTLSEKETRRLRSLLAQNPQILEEPETGGDYPRILYGPLYYTAEQEWRTNVDPLQKKRQREIMESQYRQVFDLEEEEEWLTEGWRRSPVDYLSTDKDPRIPRGREARRAADQKRLTVRQELQQLQRRMAELMAMDLGPEPEDAPPLKVSGKAVVGTGPARPSRKAAVHAGA